MTQECYERITEKRKVMPGRGEDIEPLSRPSDMVIKLDSPEDFFL